MDVEWIDRQLRERGLKRARLVEAIPGMTESKFSKVMSGARKLSADEADAIRHFFGYRLPGDPAFTEIDRIQQQLSTLSEHQIRAVVLYLEALAGNGSEPPQEG